MRTEWCDVSLYIDGTKVQIFEPTRIAGGGGGGGGQAVELESLRLWPRHAVPMNSFEAAVRMYCS